MRGRVSAMGRAPRPLEDPGCLSIAVRRYLPGIITQAVMLAGNEASSLKAESGSPSELFAARYHGLKRNPVLEYDHGAVSDSAAPSVVHIPMPRRDPDPYIEKIPRQLPSCCSWA